MHLTANLPRNLPVQVVFLNQLRFDRIMVMSLWPTFLAHPVEVDGKLGGNIRTDGRTTRKRNSSGLIC